MLCGTHGAISKCRAVEVRKKLSVARGHHVGSHTRSVWMSDDLTVTLWRFASLRLAPVSIRMCPLGFPKKHLTCTLVSPRPEGGANGGIIAKTSLFPQIKRIVFFGKRALNNPAPGMSREG